MNKFKEIWAWLKVPKVWFAVLYCVMSILLMAGTVVLVVLGFSNNVVAYLLYALSAIALAYLIYIIVYFTPKMKAGIIKALKKHRFTNELLESYGYRSIIFAVFSFIINIAYAVFQGVIAILSRSIWFGALATYYIAISLIRGGVVAVSRKRNLKGCEFPLQKQVKAYRNCGVYLVLLNFALTGAIVQMVLSEQGFKYAGILIYVMASYAFYKLGMGIYNLFKARKQNDYTIQSIKNISFADALVSILALQTALLYEFSENYQPFLPNLLTGGAVSLIIIGLGVLMIYRGQKKLNELQKEELHE